MKLSDKIFLAIYLATAIHYGLTAGFNIFKSIPVLPVAASSYFDVLALDIMGIFLLRKIGGFKSVCFLIMAGALDLWTWAITMWIVRPWMIGTIYVTWQNEIFTLL